MAQTYPNKQLIVMDDGDPVELPDSLPVVHVRMAQRAWVTEKHRLAFPLCRGKYVCYWDDDDWYAPDRLALQVEALEAGKADACGFHVKLLVSAPDAHFWKWKRETIDTWDRMAQPGFLAGLPFHDGTAMFRRELLDGIPEAVLRGTQLDLMRTMRARGARLAELPNDGKFVYVRHSRVGWDFDVRELCERADCPPWVPKEMIAFWGDRRLDAEGVARG